MRDWCTVLVIQRLYLERLLFACEYVIVQLFCCIVILARVPRPILVADNHPSAFDSLSRSFGRVDWILGVVKQTEQLACQSVMTGFSLL